MKHKQMPQFLSCIFISWILTSCNGNTHQPVTDSEQPVIIDTMPVVRPPVTDTNSTIILPPVNDKNVIVPDSAIPKKE